MKRHETSAGSSCVREPAGRPVRGKNRGKEKRGPSGIQDRQRLLIQCLSAAAFNGYADGFLKGKIFRGKTKFVCVPVLNCYSCPGALGACPIGALQAVGGGAGRRFSFYVLGLLILFGTVFGRLICGFLCPFGLIQDLLWRLRRRLFPGRRGGRKWKKADIRARKMKYIILAGVLLLPALAKNAYGFAPPYFCQFFCPAGTLQAGLPLLALDPQLRLLAGKLFGWKLLILAGVVVGALLISRFFCRYLCPLGAFYSLFNRFSFYQIRVDTQRCTACGTCEAACPMGIRIPEDPADAECIRCGRCSAACPAGVIQAGFLKDAAGSRTEEGQA